MYGVVLMALYGWGRRVNVMGITWPAPAIAVAYIAGQTVVDTWGE